MATVEIKGAKVWSFGSLFGDKNEKLISYSGLTLRLALGWIFLYAGASKLYTELTTGKLATAGYLKFGTAGPFAGFYAGLAGNTIVDALVVWGLLLIGIALILGILVRFSSIMGIAMMFLFYMSAFPPANNPFLDDHIVYILVFLMLIFLGAGRTLGLDRYIEKLKVVQKRPWLNYLLG